MYRLGGAPYKNPFFPLIVQLESPLPPKRRRRIAHFQAGEEPFTIRPGKQKQSRTDDKLSTGTSHSRADANSSSSDHPQFPVPQVQHYQHLPNELESQKFFGQFPYIVAILIPIARNFKQEAS